MLFFWLNRQAVRISALGFSEIRMGQSRGCWICDLGFHQIPTLDQIINLDNYQIISNVHQRTGRGGRPAIIVNESRYYVQNLTNTLISIPQGVEVTWALLTPKQVSAKSVVKKQWHPFTVSLTQERRLCY